MKFTVNVINGFSSYLRTVFIICPLCIVSWGKKKQGGSWGKKKQPLFIEGEYLAKVPIYFG